MDAALSTAVIASVFTLGLTAIFAWATGYLRKSGESEAEIEAKLKYSEKLNKIASDLEQVKTNQAQQSQIEVAHRTEERNALVRMYSSIANLNLSITLIDHVYKHDANIIEVKEAKSRVQAHYIEFELAYFNVEIILRNDDLISEVEAIYNKLAGIWMKIDNDFMSKISILKSFPNIQTAEPNSHPAQDFSAFCFKLYDSWSEENKKLGEVRDMMKRLTKKSKDYLGKTA